MPCDGKRNKPTYNANGGDGAMGGSTAKDGVDEARLDCDVQ